LTEGPPRDRHTWHSLHALGIYELEKNYKKQGKKKNGRTCAICAMSAIVATVAIYCEKECPPGKRCLDCIFVEYVPRVADHLAAKGKGNIVKIEEYRRGKEERNR